MPLNQQSQHFGLAFGELRFANRSHAPLFGGGQIQQFSQHLAGSPCRTILDDLDRQPNLAGSGRMREIPLGSSPNDALNIGVVLFEAKHDQTQMGTRAAKRSQQFKDVVGAGRIDQDQRNTRGVERARDRQRNNLHRPALCSVLGKDRLQPKDSQGVGGNQAQLQRSLSLFVCLVCHRLRSLITQHPAFNRPV